jgi:hypothetical protein
VRAEAGLPLVSVPKELERISKAELWQEFCDCGGQVEAWLKYLHLPSKDSGWRAEIFTAMGSDPRRSPIRGLLRETFGAS